MASPLQAVVMRRPALYRLVLKEEV